MSVQLSRKFRVEYVRVLTFLALLGRCRSLNASRNILSGTCQLDIYGMPSELDFYSKMFLEHQVESFLQDTYYNPSIEVSNFYAIVVSQRLISDVHEKGLHPLNVNMTVNVEYLSQQDDGTVFEEHMCEFLGHEGGNLANYLSESGFDILKGVSEINEHKPSYSITTISPEDLQLASKIMLGVLTCSIAMFGTFVYFGVRKCYGTKYKQKGDCKSIAGSSLFGTFISIDTHSTSSTEDMSKQVKSYVLSGINFSRKDSKDGEEDEFSLCEQDDKRDIAKEIIGKNFLSPEQSDKSVELKDMESLTIQTSSRDAANGKLECGDSLSQASHTNSELINDECIISLQGEESIRKSSPNAALVFPYNKKPSVRIEGIHFMEDNYDHLKSPPQCEGNTVKEVKKMHEAKIDSFPISHIYPIVRTEELESKKTIKLDDTLLLSAITKKAPQYLIQGRDAEKSDEEIEVEKPIVFSKSDPYVPSNLHPHFALSKHTSSNTPTLPCRSGVVGFHEDDIKSINSGSFGTNDIMSEVSLPSLASSRTSLSFKYETMSNVLRGVTPLSIDMKSTREKEDHGLEIRKPIYRKEYLDILASKESSSKISTMQKRLIRNFVAPPGKLGVIIKRKGAASVVHQLKETSPLSGKLFPGDHILSINEIDTSEMTGLQVTMVMKKLMDMERKITVSHSKINKE